MQITVNGNLLEVPFDLTQIKLSEFIDFRQQYGNDLDKELADILKQEYEGDEELQQLEKFIAIDNHIDREGLAWFSFWTKHDFVDAMHLPGMSTLLAQYRLLRNAMDDSTNEAYSFPLLINWQGEEWEIKNYKVEPGSDMSFNEIITSKEIMRQLAMISAGKWDGLPYLCAVFLRKKGEAFKDEFVHPDSERMNLFNELPLTHAMQVAFFLNVCVCIWASTLAYSANQVEAILSQS